MIFRLVIGICKDIHNEVVGYFAAECPIGAVRQFHRGLSAEMTGMIGRCFMNHYIAHESLLFSNFPKVVMRCRYWKDPSCIFFFMIDG